jgi:uncharacterized membrane protein YkoI
VADQSIDAEKVRALYASGTILSLQHLTNQARKMRPGKLINAKLTYEDSHSIYVYEIELLDHNGEAWEYEFDAQTGVLIEHEKAED